MTRPLLICRTHKGRQSYNVESPHVFYAWVLFEDTGGELQPVLLTPDLAEVTSAYQRLGWLPEQHILWLHAEGDGDLDIWSYRDYVSLLLEYGLAPEQPALFRLRATYTYGGAPGEEDYDAEFDCTLIARDPLTDAEAAARWALFLDLDGEPGPPVVRVTSFELQGGTDDT